MRKFREEDGTVTSWWKEGDKVVTKHTRDVEPLLNQNARLQNETTGFNADKSMKRVASIDPVVLQKWCSEAGIKPRDVLKRPREYSKWLRSKVYDSDNRMFLASPVKTTSSVRIRGLDDVIREGRRIGHN